MSKDEHDVPVANAAGKAESHPITTLSFVQDRPEGRCFWAVEPTGDWIDDCVAGETLAHEAIEFMRAHQQTALLGLVVKAMGRDAGDLDGIAVGFLGVIAQRAAGLDAMGSPAAAGFRYQVRAEVLADADAVHLLCRIGLLDKAEIYGRSENLPPAAD
jgi:hypothetical protein